MLCAKDVTKLPQWQAISDLAKQVKKPVLVLGPKGESIFAIE